MRLPTTSRAGEPPDEAAADVLYDLRLRLARKGCRLWRLEPDHTQFTDYGPYTVLDALDGRVVRRALTLPELRLLLDAMENQSLPAADEHLV